MKKILIVLMSLLTLAACKSGDSGKNIENTGMPSAPVEAKPLNIIFDTDMGNDIDDALALQMLLNYEKAGRLNLLGITICKANPHAIPFVDGYCRFNGRNDIPLGYVYDGVTPEDGTFLLPTLNAEYNGKPIMEPVRTIDSNLPEAYKLIRQLLAAAEDGSVTLIAVGPMTNMGRLMTSQADEISPLSGVELVKAKVCRVVTMAALFSEKFPFPEWNVECDVPSCRNLFELCPVPLTTSGYEVGYELKYPHTSILSDFGTPEAHPLCVAYRSYMQMPYDRETWDLTAVLEAVEPGKWFNYSSKGSIKLDEYGNAVLEPSKNGLQNYLVMAPEQQPLALKALVDRTTGKKL